MAENNAEPREAKAPSKHWSEAIADQVVGTKKPPFVITGGITTSGPTHLGTVCEFLYPSVVKEILIERGQTAEFHFIGDILDAFDSIPSDLVQYKAQLEPYLGVPLVNVPDPVGCHQSIGDHYLADAQDVMTKMNLTIDVLRVNEIYEAGKFDPYAKIFLQKEAETKQVVAETSGRKVEDLPNWSPIMPICEKCGKIATTRVTWHDDASYSYTDDGNAEYVKGCGYSGKGKISDHKYKLQWRLHWPAWQAIFDTAAEGAGKDHHTRGGSWDTALVIHQKILLRQPPVDYKWGFILFEGKKYSKSKGIGMGTSELLKLMPPELIAYMLVEPNIQQDKNISPTGEKILVLFDDIERIALMQKTDSRADEKKMLAFKLTIRKLRWKTKFVDVLIYYQIHKDWEKVATLLNDRDGVMYLAPYIEEWINRNFEPERYRFALKPGKAKRKELVIAFDGELKDNMSALDIHNLVYSVAEKCGVKTEEMFAELYGVLIGKDSGPRFGKLIEAIGTKRTKEIFADSLQ